MGELQQGAVEIARTLRGAGYECYFAGGYVRDRLLGQAASDIDIATSARPAEILEIFPGVSLSVGAHFGVVLVRSMGYSYDVVTFREDGEYHDGRRPEHVSFSDAEHDARRRDFTVNGLFEDPFTGEIVDYVNGLQDLEQRLIRAIGDPAARFREDALRLMRAVRFATVKDFGIEPATWQAVKDCSGLLSRISVERIQEEFNRILLSPRRRKGIEMLVDTGLMQHIIPEVLALVGCEQPPQFHPEGDVFVHTMMMLDLIGDHPSLPLALAVLLHDIGKPVTGFVDETGRIRFSGHDKAGSELCRLILERLRYPNKVIDQVCFMVERHMKFMHVKSMRPSTLRRFMDSETFSDELELHRADCLSSHRMLDNYDFVNEALESLDDGPVMPASLISGRDLIGAGYQPGPAFKDILQQVMNDQIEGRVNNREEALAAARRYFDGKIEG